MEGGREEGSSPDPAPPAVGCCLSNLRGDPFQHNGKPQSPTAQDPGKCACDGGRLIASAPKPATFSSFRSFVFRSFLVNCGFPWTGALNDSARDEAKVGSLCGMCLAELPLKRLSSLPFAYTPGKNCQLRHVTYVPVPACLLNVCTQLSGQKVKSSICLLPKRMEL